LGNGLPGQNGQGAVVVGMVAVFGEDKQLSRNLAHGSQNGRIVQTPPFYLFRYHSMASLLHIHM
jgi:hypothetical protein